MGGLVEDDGSLYGTTRLGGMLDRGTVFMLHTDGSGYRVQHSFSGASDGQEPRGGLMRASNGRIYGTTYLGGSYDGGTVFQLGGGTGIITLHHFNSSRMVHVVDVFHPDPVEVWLEVHDAMNPVGRLVEGPFGRLYGRTEYGTTFPSDDWWSGGTRTRANGSLFMIWETGADGPPEAHPTYFHLFDGVLGDSGMVLGTNGALYGASVSGIFRLSPTVAGWHVEMIHRFEEVGGFMPAGELLPTDDGLLYGVGCNSGEQRTGAIFRIRIDGSDFETVCALPGAPALGLPTAGLLRGAAGDLLGVTSFSYLGGGLPGEVGGGSLFRVKPDGTGFSVLHHFAGRGGTPTSLIEGIDGRLYGTAARTMVLNDADTGLGIIFSVNKDGSDYQALHRFGMSPTLGTTPI